MKQGCLSWNTNTLLTLCVCVWTAPWGQNDSRALRRKSYLAQRRGFFSSLLVPKNKPKNSPSWESGTKKSEGCWPAPAPPQRGRANIKSKVAQDNTSCHRCRCQSTSEAGWGNWPNLLEYCLSWGNLPSLLKYFSSVGKWPLVIDQVSISS